MRLLCALMLFCACALAQEPPALQFRQNLGADLPLQTMFRDAAGNSARLGDYFGKYPVVMVFGYYHCPRLCDTVMDGVLQGVQNAGLPHVIVGIGIDPRESADDASRKLAAYQGAGDHARDLHLLTGGRDQIARLAHAAGFEYEYDEESGQYSHPAGFLVATPEGKISRYFTGLRFDRRDVRLALIEASDERVGSLAEQVLLLCSHYDPLTARYSVTVMAIVRIAAFFGMAALALGIWAARRHGANRRPKPSARRSA